MKSGRRAAALRLSLLATLAGLVSCLSVVGTAQASVNATLNIYPGALTFVGSTPSVHFNSATVNATAKGELYFNVSNPGGGAPPFRILAAVASPNSGGDRIAIGGLAGTPSCDANSPCTPARPVQGYPMTIASGHAPQTIFQSAPGTGLENELIGLSFAYISGSARSAQTTSWTFTLVSGP